MHGRDLVDRRRRWRRRRGVGAICARPQPLRRSPIRPWVLRFQARAADPVAAAPTCDPHGEAAGPSGGRDGPDVEWRPRRPGCGGAVAFCLCGYRGPRRDNAAVGGARPAKPAHLAHAWGCPVRPCRRWSERPPPAIGCSPIASGPIARQINVLQLHADCRCFGPVTLEARDLRVPGMGRAVNHRARAAIGAIRFVGEPTGVRRVVRNRALSIHRKRAQVRRSRAASTHCATCAGRV